MQALVCPAVLSEGSFDNPHVISLTYKSFGSIWRFYQRLISFVRVIAVCVPIGLPRTCFGRVMDHSSHFSVSSPSCKLCPNTLLPDDGHDHCPSCLGIQHLKEAMTDPCLYCAMLPLSERQLCLAELDPNSSASLAQPYIAPRHAQKRRTSAAAGAPPTKKKCLPKTENSLSKTVASLSSEMAEMKCLLQSLQPPVPTAPTKTASVNESDFQPPNMIALDALSMSASNSHFLDEELVDPAMQPGPPQEALSGLSAAGGSSGGSVHSSSAGQSSPDDILSILQMAMARLGLDRSVQPAQSNVFFRQNADTTFTMPQCKDFVTEFSSALTSSNAPRRRSKSARTLDSMAEANSIGVARAPEIEQPVAALVVSPDEALRGNVHCPSAQCGRTDTFLKKAYESVAYITRAENTICQLLLASNATLESANVDPSVPQFLQTALLTMGHVTRELGTLSATLLTARRQVWLAQARLPEDCKKTLRELPIVPGHLFGPNISEQLEKRMKLSEATRQLTQAPRAPSFRMPSTPAHPRYSSSEQQLRHHSGSQLQTPQRHRVAEETQSRRPFPRHHQGGLF